MKETGTMKQTFALQAPAGRRQLWRVQQLVDGREVGFYRCDGEDIARELLRRLQAGQAPGWVAHDLRHLKGPEVDEVRR